MKPDPKLVKRCKEILEYNERGFFAKDSEILKDVANYPLKNSVWPNLSPYQRMQIVLSSVEEDAMKFVIENS